MAPVEYLMVGGVRRKEICLTVLRRWQLVVGDSLPKVVKCSILAKTGCHGNNNLGGGEVNKNTWAKSEGSDSSYSIF